MTNEEIKAQSRFLRGTITDELQSDAAKLNAENAQLLKFHGSYQQENRDERRARRSSGADKAYSFMVRSRIPGGALTAAQYLAHDRIATRLGNGTLRFTTRQGIQLHGILKGELRDAIAAINDALLTTLAACGDVNRNVMTCPAPVGDALHADIQRIAHEIALRLAPRTRAYHEIWIDGERVETPAPAESEPVYGTTYLPRKFKIGIGLPDDNCVDVFTQDLGFVAEISGDSLRGFTVLVGGGMGSTHGKKETYARLGTPLCFVGADEAVEVAEAIVKVYRDFGDRENRKHARLKYVIEERGIGWFREELQARIGRTLAPPLPIEIAAVHDHLGWHRSADGTWYLGLYVENGRVADRPEIRLKGALRLVLAQTGCALRITGQQNLVLTGITDAQRPQIDAIFAAHGIELDPRALGLHRQAMACPALPTCGLAVAEAERALPALIDELEQELATLGVDPDELPSIRMTGCPNGCARPRMGDIGIVGRSLDLYDVFVGGDAENTRLNALHTAAVRRADLVPLLSSELRRWSSERRPGERFGDFVFRQTSDYSGNSSIASTRSG